MTGGVKLRFKSASYSVDDGLYIAEFLCPKKTNIVAAIGGRKNGLCWCRLRSLNKLPALYNFQTGRGLVWNQ